MYIHRSQTSLHLFVLRVFADSHLRAKKSNRKKKKKTLHDIFCTFTGLERKKLEFEFLKVAKIPETIILGGKKGHWKMNSTFFSKFFLRHMANNMFHINRLASEKTNRMHLLIRYSIKYNFSSQTILSSSPASRKDPSKHFRL